MVDVIGPNGYLPGQHLLLPKGVVVMCDEHPERVAVIKIVGETDSFGSEIYAACQACVDQARLAPPLKGRCDWCKTDNCVLTHHRDYEEGSCGRVYEVCGHCIAQENKRLDEEDRSSGYLDTDWDD